jgi:hypothetical protein
LPRRHTRQMGSFVQAIWAIERDPRPRHGLKKDTLQQTGHIVSLDSMEPGSVDSNWSGSSSSTKELIFNLQLLVLIQLEVHAESFFEMGWGSSHSRVSRAAYKSPKQNMLHHLQVSPPYNPSGWCPQFTNVWRSSHQHACVKANAP